MLYGFEMVTDINSHVTYARGGIENVIHKLRLKNFVFKKWVIIKQLFSNNCL